MGSCLRRVSEEVLPATAWSQQPTFLLKWPSFESLPAANLRFRRRPSRASRCMRVGRSWQARKTAKSVGPRQAPLSRCSTPATVGKGKSRELEGGGIHQPRVRHFGLLANRSGRQMLKHCRSLLGMVHSDPPAKEDTAPAEHTTTMSPEPTEELCPVGRRGRLRITVMHRVDPPQGHFSQRPRRVPAYCDSS
jgi:hypothetical protein